MHVDNSVKLIGDLLFGLDNSLKTLNTVRPAGQVLVDNWACLKFMVRDLEHYILKYMQVQLSAESTFYGA
ncbi:hypothetical protein KC19_2G144400 [Ceratodon purpureus]|uniref:Legumain prodomain domain-containing protein n=1 Tax=Ceratodon purpureus TaxID=3225 RepID=A0A8T0IW37_CERPU|nr:hypothetical protein KC19_2G144400 [Ceratodon purpureus]